MSTEPRKTKRVAFTLPIRKGMEEAYDKSHEQVWPEMLGLLSRCGVSEYSIFRRDTTLCLVMAIPAEDTFDQVWDRIEADEINTRWQKTTAPFFEPLTGLREGERFPMMAEVFYMA
jgi:L-rhamnose mutarotase